MHRRHLSLTIALCLSLCVHAWAIHALIKHGSWAMRGGTAPSSAIAKKRPAPIVLVQLPPKEALPKELEDEFGLPTGKGKAINAMDGARPLRAKKAPDEQAALTRKPGEHRPDEIVSPEVTNRAKLSRVAAGGRGRAAEKMLAALDPGNQAKPEMVGVTESAIPNNSEGSRKVESKKTESLNHRSIEASKEIGARPTPPPEHSSSIAVAMSHATEKAPSIAKAVAKMSDARDQTARKALVPAGNGGGAVAGQAGQALPTASGDPGEKSESESDAFSNVGSANFEGGRLEARFGRKVRTVRPNFGLAGQMALENMVDPSLQFEIHTDKNGKPTDVELLQSSGSTDVDEPVRLALYDWWFEPPKDSHGKPMADVMVWTISFR